MDELEKKINEHELDCVKRYGEIIERFTKHEGAMDAIKISVGWNTKLIWFVFASVMAFELNALFKLVGH